MENKCAAVIITIIIKMMMMMMKITDTITVFLMRKCAYVITFTSVN